MSTIESSFNPAKARMTGNNVLLEPLPKETRSAGGLHLLPQFSDDRMQWKVIAAGPGRKNKKGVLVAPEVKVGDKCLCKMDFGFIALDNGMRVIDAKYLEMKWDYEEP